MCYLPAKSTSSACELNPWLDMAMEVDSKARSIAREDGKGGGTQWLVPPSRSLLGKKHKTGYQFCVTPRYVLPFFQQPGFGFLTTHLTFKIITIKFQSNLKNSITCLG